MTTFVFDPHAGMTVDQIKQRCRELVRAVDRYGLIIAMLVEYAPSCVLTNLPDDLVKEAKQIHAARRDDTV